MSYGPEHWHCRIGYIKPRGNIALFPNVVAPELPVDGQPADNIIEMLQRLLARAMSGELRAVACAYVKRADGTSWNWTQAPGGYTTHQLSAAIGDLAFGYAHARAKCADEGTQMPGNNE